MRLRVSPRRLRPRPGQYDGLIWLNPTVGERLKSIADDVAGPTVDPHGVDPKKRIAMTDITTLFLLKVISEVLLQS